MINNNLTETDYACILASIRERILLQNFQKLYPTFDILKVSKVESKDKWDAILFSGGGFYVTECKVRDQNKNYDDWILQQDKFIALTGMTHTTRAVQLNTQAYYLCFFRNGARLWSVKNEDNHNWFIRDSKSTTAHNSHNRKDKVVTYLKNDRGVSFDYVNDIKKVTAEAKIVFRFMFPGVEVPSKGIWQ